MPTFLIADDSSEKIFMLQKFLKRAKWQGEILIARTCQEAYHVIDTHDDISAAFVDYYIPKDNGPAIIKALKKKFPLCKIALVSSSDNAKNATEAREAGAEEVICTTHHSDYVEAQLLAFVSVRFPR